MTDKVRNPFSRGEVDLAAEDSRLVADLNGQPVDLVPLPNGDIGMVPRGGRVGDGYPSARLTTGGGRSSTRTSTADLAELTRQLEELTGRDLGRSSATGEPTDDEMVAAWESWRAGEGTELPGGVGDFSGAEETASDADLSDDNLFEGWRAYAVAEGIIDLALAVGDAVEWGEGQGKGHGILMEIGTAEGKANVHTAEVVNTPGAGEQLAPTGRMIKIDAEKLRPSNLKLVGESRIGPELSGGDPVDNVLVAAFEAFRDGRGLGVDLAAIGEADAASDAAADLAAGADDALDDGAFYEMVNRELEKQEGGFGA